MANMVIRQLIFLWLLQKVILHHENIVCDIVSNNQIEIYEFYIMNLNGVIEFTVRHNKIEVTLYCRKFSPDFTCQDEYELNTNELPPLIITDGYLCEEEEI